MPLTKLQLRPGVNKENTRYTNENGWYISEKIRFRQGTPAKIGGWQRISGSTFLGVCRALWNWVTLSFENLLAIGTNLKLYIERGGTYYDITPLRSTETLTNPFTTVSGSAVVTVTDATHGGATGDFVTFSGATSPFNGLELNNNYQITVTGTNTYTITAANTASASGSGGGTVTAKYEIDAGPAIQGGVIGWGAGGWGTGTWGFGTTGTESTRLWHMQNWGKLS